MMERLEATASLLFNLYKNPASPTVAGFATKTIMSPNLKSLRNICVTLLQKLLEVSVYSRVHSIVLKMIMT